MSNGLTILACLLLRVTHKLGFLLFKTGILIEKLYSKLKIFLFQNTLLNSFRFGKYLKSSSRFALRNACISHCESLLIFWDSNQEEKVWPKFTRTYLMQQISLKFLQRLSMWNNQFLNPQSL